MTGEHTIAAANICGLTGWEERSNQIACRMESGQSSRKLAWVCSNFICFLICSIYGQNYWYLSLHRFHWIVLSGALSKFILFSFKIQSIKGNAFTIDGSTYLILYYTKMLAFVMHISFLSSYWSIYVCTCTCMCLYVCIAKAMWTFLETFNFTILFSITH